MGVIFETALDFFKEDNLNQWRFTKDVDHGIIHLDFQGNDMPCTFYAKALEEDYQFVFYSLLSFKSPSNKMPSVAEFLARANYNLIIGNFEMDYTDGEIRYKTSIDVEGSRLIPAMIKQLVYSNLFRVNQYFPGILEVIQSNISPKEIILEIENSI
jgi:hypothetical protein